MSYVCWWLAALHGIQFYKQYWMCGQYGGSHLWYKWLVCWKYAEIEWCENWNADHWIQISSNLPNTRTSYWLQRKQTCCYCQNNWGNQGFFIHYGAAYQKHNEGSFLSDIREIPYYRRFFIPFCAKTLVHAFITFKLDYCNGLLYASQHLNRLQSI